MSCFALIVTFQPTHGPVVFKIGSAQVQPIITDIRNQSTCSVTSAVVCWHKHSIILLQTLRFDRSLSSRCCSNLSSKFNQSISRSDTIVYAPKITRNERKFWMVNFSQSRAREYKNSYKFRLSSTEVFFFFFLGFGVGGGGGGDFRQQSKWDQVGIKIWFSFILLHFLASQTEGSNSTRVLYNLGTLLLEVLDSNGSLWTAVQLSQVSMHSEILFLIIFVRMTVRGNV